MLELGAKLEVRTLLEVGPKLAVAKKLEVQSWNKVQTLVVVGTK